jgi:hypothetical protein
MNYDIFNEEYYLQRYPFVANAIEQGLVSSGLAHFQQWGQALGYVEVSRYFDEEFYLAHYPDVANGVNLGVVASGLDHFIQFGYNEGRIHLSSDYDEAFYLTTNPDVNTAVEQGFYRNGLEHFIQFGAAEGRLGSSFLEPEYLVKNPDVDLAVEAGIFRTGRDHYEQFGQFEPSRSVTFVGTRGDDIVTGFGVGQIELIGVEVGLDAEGNRIYESDGLDNENFIGENDILVGSPGADTFVVGTKEKGDFYPSFLGIVRIRNFDPALDSIQLAGTRGSGYTVFSGTDITISNAPGSAIAVIEGGAAFSSSINYIFLGEKPLEQNFLESEYFSENPDVAADVTAGIYQSGLDHYQQIGQFEPERSATFSGTPGNDVITAFGVGSHDIIGVESFYSGQDRRTYTSNGSDEFDTLIGSPGADRFIFGDVTLSSRGFLLGTTTFYRGEGVARIEGFSQTEGDSIELIIGSVEEYSVLPVGEDLVISVGTDPIAILMDSADLTLTAVIPFDYGLYQSITFV